MATVPASSQASDPGPGVTLRRLVVLGIGEHSRVVAEAARATPMAWEVIGHTVAPEAGDQRGTSDGAGGDRAATPVIGTDLDIARRLAGAGDEAPWLVLGFGGDPGSRRRAVEALGPAARWAVVVHPTAWVSPTARIDQGAVVLAGAVVNAGAVVGSHAIVNTGAIVEHDVRVGPFAHLAPGVVVGGGTSVGEDTVIGLGATVRDHVSIGARVTVAMGAVVVRDVADGDTVLGVPARSWPDAS